MTEKVYVWLILILIHKVLSLRANLNFTHDALQELRVKFRKVTFGCFKLLPQPFGSMYFNETWQICKMEATYYQE